jgi:hypothetical protein
LKIGGHNAATV